MEVGELSRREEALLRRHCDDGGRSATDMTDVFFSSLQDVAMLVLYRARCGNAVSQAGSQSLDDF